MEKIFLQTLQIFRLQRLVPSFNLYTSKAKPAPTSNHQTTNQMKSTKTQIREAVDNFFYSYYSLTGGTREEILRQAPRGIEFLTERADLVASLAENPNKLAAADAHLMSMVKRVAENRAFYAEKYLPAEPTNIIPFKAA